MGISIELRQSADAAQQLLDLLGDQVWPELRTDVEALFCLDERLTNAPPSVEFMQGLFSGVSMCHTLMGRGHPKEVVAQLMIEIGRRYLETLEKNI